MHYFRNKIHGNIIIQYELSVKLMILHVLIKKPRHGRGFLKTLYYHSGDIASTGHSPAQVPQSVHSDALITYFPSPSDIASTGQTAAHVPQEVQSLEIT